MSESQDNRRLTRCERLSVAVLGTLFLLCAGVAWCYPPPRIQAVTGSAEAKVFVVSADPTLISLACLGFGGAFILLAMNGLRISRAKVWDFEVGAEDPKEALKKLASTGALTEPAPVIAAETAGANAGEESAPGAPATVWIDGEEYGVYRLKDVPPEIVQDLMQSSEWQNRGYGSLDVEFVARRSGRGNHAWAFKFHDRDSLWWVSRGGRGKEDATITIAPIPRKVTK